VKPFDIPRPRCYNRATLNRLKGLSSVLVIYTTENPQQREVLRGRARKVTKITPRLLAAVEEMLETMRHASGVGLAAPQVGIRQRFFVVELPEDEEEGLPRETYVLFNPKIVKSQGEQVGIEGCLSIPGYVGEVARFEQVTLKALDEQGRPVRHKVDGYLARVFQHEIDHLDGVLYTDRMTDPATFRPVTAGDEEAEELAALA